MALACLDRQTGQIIHFPRPGGWHEQDSYEISLMRTAWRVWAHFKIKGAQLWEDVPQIVELLE